MANSSAQTLGGLSSQEKSQTVAFATWLGGEERLEDLIVQFPGDTRAVIGDLHKETAVLLQVSSQEDFGRLHSFTRLERIESEVGGQ